MNRLLDESMNCRWPILYWKRKTYSINDFLRHNILSHNRIYEIAQYDGQKLWTWQSLSKEKKSLSILNFDLKEEKFMIKGCHFVAISTHFYP